MADWSDEGQVADYLAKIVRKEAFDKTGLVYGMGHAVYTKSDPRAIICKQFAEGLAVGTEFEAEFNLLKSIERLAPEVILREKGTSKDMCANIDMYSGFVYSMMGIPEDLFTPLFACARMSGWAAHRFEEIVSGKRIIRPAYKSTRSGKRERISRLFQMNSKQEIPMESIDAGDIGAGVGFKDIRTGDTLCDEEHPIVLESMTFPDTVISIAVEPKSQADIAKMDNGLAKLAEEDPTFTVRTDEQSGQTIISGMGELHLDIIIDRLKREFKVECNQGKPQVNYKEAITKTAQSRETYKKQSGGRGKFACIDVTIGPKDEDYKEGDLQFINEVKGGNVPKEFIPSVQKGFADCLSNGVLGGFPMTGLKVTLTDGSFHPVDSDQLSFELVAHQAFKVLCPKAGPVLMEPIMKVEVVTPEENMGDVIGDLNKRRGLVQGMEEGRSGARIVKAMVPLAEMFGYVTALRTITSGRATSSMEYDHHAPLSSTIAKAVLEEVKGHAELL